MAACMTHHCRDCAHEWPDNNPSAICQRCGSTNVAHYFDEDPNDLDDEDDTDLWEEEDE